MNNYLVYYRLLGLPFKHTLLVCAVDENTAKGVVLQKHPSCTITNAISQGPVKLAEVIYVDFKSKRRLKAGA